jgi:hypothetical protein
VEEFRQTWYQAMKEASKEGVKVVWTGEIP